MLVHIGQPPPPAETLETVDEVLPESDERRVTRTLAQALHTFEKQIVQTDPFPDRGNLLPVVYAGGTQERFSKMASALAEPDIAFVETGFTRAAAEPARSDLPSRTSIPTEARALVAEAARVLADTAPDPLRVVVGQIIRRSTKSSTTLFVATPDDRRTSHDRLRRTEPLGRDRRPLLHGDEHGSHSQGRDAEVFEAGDALRLLMGWWPLFVRLEARLSALVPAYADRCVRPHCGQLQIVINPLSIRVRWRSACAPCATGSGAEVDSNARVCSGTKCSIEVAAVNGLLCQGVLAV